MKIVKASPGWGPVERMCDECETVLEVDEGDLEISEGALGEVATPFATCPTAGCGRSMFFPDLPAYVRRRIRPTGPGIARGSYLD